MANALVIYEGSGPLPVTAQFRAPSDGDVIFVLTGTTRTTSAPILTGINLSIDGVQIGAPAVCWANQDNNHLAMRPTFIPFEDLTFGEHTISIEIAFSTTVTDTNDYFQVTLLY